MRRIPVLSACLKIVALCCCFAICSPPPCHASTTEEYRKVQRDLRQQKKNLERAKRAERSVLSDLRRFSTELAELDDQISRKRNQIGSMKSQISGLEKDIGVRAASLEEQRAHLRNRLLTLQRIAMQKDAILMILSNDDSAKALRVGRYLTDISTRYSESVTGYQTEIRELGSKKKSLESLVQGLKTEERTLGSLEASARDKKQEKEKLLVQVRKEKGTYEQMVKELKDSSERLSRIIKDSEKSSRKRSPAKGKERQPSASSDETPAGSAFSRHKGQFPWPVAGSIAIRYGSQIDPLFNLPVFRNGIHFKAPGGAPVTAVAGGQVVYADEFKGYGRLVILSHGSGYYTLYGNLARIFPPKDAIIKERQPVGEVGDSTALGSSGVYFEIRYKGKSLDPQQWLKRSGG